MKQLALRFYNYMFGVKGIVFTLYTILVFSAYAFTLYVDTSLAYVLRAVVFISVAALVFCPFILKKINESEFKLFSRSNTTIKALKRFITYFLIALSVFLIYYLAHFPGGFSPDTINQYKQAISDNYNDWHPTLHTILAIKLPLLITGGWIGSIALFQLLFFSLALAYMSSSIEMYINRKASFFLLALILLNPATGNLGMYPWKDISFAIVVLTLMIYLFKIYYTDGIWIKSLRNTILMILLLVLATVFRHNGVLFTLSYCIIIFFFFTKKRGLIILISFLLLTAGIKGPLYSAINVEKPDSRQIETLGLPMTVIGAVVANDPDSLDKDTLNFAYKVAPKNVWEQNYVYGDFSSVKFLEQTDLQVIEDAGAFNVLKIMLKCIKDSPQKALTGLIKLTEVVYSINDNSRLYSIQTGIMDNDVNITYQGVLSVKQILNIYTKITSVLFGHLFLFVGLWHLLLLIVVCAKCKLRTFNGWKKALFSLPIFTYNFGTMLLLTGPGEPPRFFYYTFLVAPIGLIVMLSQNKQKYMEV